MPEPFQPENLLASLRPLAAAASLSPAEQAYRQFYGFSDTWAARSRMGMLQAAEAATALRMGTEFQLR